MNTRRQFIQGTVAPLALSALGPALAAHAFDSALKPAPTGPGLLVSQRPPVAQRKFVSAAVEQTIVAAKARIADPETAWLFENCFPNTLDTTVTTRVVEGRPDTYVITGDIDAMWLRDSAAQVWPYLPLMKQDAALQSMIAGVVNRQARCVLLDPYANAFYDNPDKVSYHKDDLPKMKPGVHERKWEVDSLCYVIRLAHGYWKQGGDVTCFDAQWLEAMKLIVATFRNQQRKTGDGDYKFKHKTMWPSDTAAGSGTGHPVAPVGLIASVFRPSDDGTVFPFLIPSNYFAANSLRQLGAMVRALYRDPAFPADCLSLAAEVERALQKHAVIEHKTHGRILAYEVDGYGSHYLIDDSNVPSLISMAYPGAIGVNDPLYRSTRKFLFNAANQPYYVKGRAAEGTSGPHAGRDMIWPMGIIIRAMTTNDDAEIKRCLKMLAATHAGTGFMHEAFHKDDPAKFTRKWFAWANTLYGEMILRLLESKPHLLG
ncbi:glycoside hydrolase family 125 protein [Massilia glaciei]|uniref:glycoside hydrolase family 125 protein n=1 Tax=Massilia glaciei TaxID=1524097 RepID=UPI001C635C99|nr:glycoside hydrolase family 125 protein [Massilia glaciei]